MRTIEETLAELGKDKPQLDFKELTNLLLDLDRRLKQLEQAK